MRGNDYDEEAARREPLLASEASGSGGAANEGGGGSSRRPSPNRTLSPDRALKDASTPGGAFRLTRRSSTLAQVGWGGA